MTGLLEAGGEARRAPADVREADGDGRHELRLDAAYRVDQPFDSRRRDAQQAADRLVATVEERARRDVRERPLEPVLGRIGHEDHVGSVERAAELLRACEETAGVGAPARQLLEEVLD